MHELNRKLFKTNDGLMRLESRPYERRVNGKSQAVKRVRRERRLGL